MENTITFATEQAMQAYCFKWFDNTFPEERRMMHCNNNNSSDSRAGNKAKAVGVVKGVADLEWVIPFGMIFIEMKLPGQVQKPEQIDFMNKVRARGHVYVIIYSFEEFREFVLKTIKSFS